MLIRNAVNEHEIKKPNLRKQNTAFDWSQSTNKVTKRENKNGNRDNEKIGMELNGKNITENRTTFEGRIIK